MILLHNAAGEGSKLTVKMLLEDGRFYPNTVDVLERTPLHMAVLQRNCDCVSLLLSDAWVNRNARDYHGLEAVHYAKRSNDTYIAKMFLADSREKIEGWITSHELSVCPRCECSCLIDHWSYLSREWQSMSNACFFSACRIFQPPPKCRKSQSRPTKF